MQMFEILCYKLCCATFTRSTAVPPSHDCITYITWHHTRYPSMQGYDIVARKPRRSLFLRLPISLSTTASYLVHYTIYPYTVYRRVSNSLVDLQHLLCPFYKVMGCTPFTRDMECYINYDFIAIQYITQSTYIMGHSNKLIVIIVYLYKCLLDIFQQFTFVIK